MRDCTFKTSTPRPKKLPRASLNEIVNISSGARIKNCTRFRKGLGNLRVVELRVVSCKSRVASYVEVSSSKFLNLENENFSI